MRCKACDAVLQDHEIYPNAKTNKLEELCAKCRGVSYAAALDLDIDEVDDGLEALGAIAKYEDDNQDTWEVIPYD